MKFCHNLLIFRLLFAALAQVMKHSQAKYRALGNMGEVLCKMGGSSAMEEAIKVYVEQLSLAKQIRDRGLEAGSYGSLGVCHRMLKQFDKALGFHTQVSQKFPLKLRFGSKEMTPSCFVLEISTLAGRKVVRFGGGNKVF